MVPSRAARSAPPTTIRRLSTYYRVLGALHAEGRANASSRALAQLTGFTAAQVRRDLTYFGTFGKRGVGYAVAPLRRRLAAILGIDRGWRVALIGVGNLGRALLAYQGFGAQGFTVAAAFDNDPRMVGAAVGGQTVLPVERLARAVREQRIDMVVVTVPAAAAQPVVDRAVAAGVRAVLNFAPAKLQVPDHVELAHVDLAVELEYLAYCLSR